MTRTVTAAIILATGFGLAQTAYAASPAIPASAASVTMAQARASALKAHPGTITDAELEREKGGSGLRYSFDIRRGGQTYEVGIDAKTGAVLENKAEGKNPD